MNPFLLMPIAMDFLRRVALQRGRVLFIEANEEGKRDINAQLIRECLIMCLNAIY